MSSFYKGNYLSTIYIPRLHFDAASVIKEDRWSGLSGQEKGIHYRAASSPESNPIFIMKNKGSDHN
jgi:hypothetical protein